MVIKSNFNDGSTPAKKPTGVNGSHILNSGVKLNWTDKAYNETAYYVYRSFSKYGTYSLLNDGATNKDSVSYLDNTIAPVTQYYYYVAGKNVSGSRCFKRYHYSNYRKQ